MDCFVYGMRLWFSNGENETHHTRTDVDDDDNDDDGSIVTTTMMMTPKMDRNVQKVTTTTNGDSELGRTRWFEQSIVCVNVVMSHYCIPGLFGQSNNNRGKKTPSHISLLCVVMRFSRAAMRMFERSAWQTEYTIESNVQFHLNFIRRQRTNERSAEVGDSRISFQSFGRRRTKQMCIWLSPAFTFFAIYSIRWDDALLNWS